MDLYLSLDLGALQQLDEGFDGVAVADEKTACDLAGDVLECARGGAAHAWLGVVEEAHQPSDAALPPNHTYGVHIGAYIVERSNRPRPDLHSRRQQRALQFSTTIPAFANLAVAQTKGKSWAENLH